MYDFEVKVKVASLCEIEYEEVVKENDRDGVYDRKVVKTERFAEWAELRTFAYALEREGKKILQVVEIKDLTNRLRNDMTSQGKD